VSDKYEEMHDKFLRVEDEENLFLLEIDGVLVWERIRHYIYRRILRRSELIGQAHTGSTLFQSGVLKKYSWFAYRWARSLLIKNPFLTAQKDFLFHTVGRRKKRDDGYWWDIHCDPITEELDLDYVLVENHHQDTHRRPARTGNIRYLDFIEDTGVVCMKLGLAEVSFSAREKQRMGEVTDAFESEFGVSIDLEAMIEQHLTKRKSTKWMYNRLVKRVDPEIAVVVAGAYQKNFIEVCKDNDVPVVELQHGGGHHKHLGYTFPEDVTLQVFPDYLFVFGDFWKDTVDYPIPDENVYAVGYPYLEEERKKYSNKRNSGKVIFISQGTIGKRLSKFATRFSEHNDDYEIIYKLHPGEYSRWQNEYPWLVDAPLEVIDDDSIPLYKLLAESEALVGVYSTVIYEGLIFDLDIYLLADVPWVTLMDYLVEQDVATKVTSAKELKELLEQPDSESDFDIDYFFRPNPIENISEAFGEILQNKY